ncbi:hypothetical protein L1987_46246 [Smallanthus sonchifolius]|uniref:Uncharacterized protein n=1 Tax=Smallanthus sonchifolius TaxID=185202 RepID=A0ACB9G064_9ASTR|nr:hypothetical protein L1987_46246 [Smallanthus sonchifolius]
MVQIGLGEIEVSGVRSQREIEWYFEIPWSYSLCLSSYFERGGLVRVGEDQSQGELGALGWLWVGTANIFSLWDECRCGEVGWDGLYLGWGGMMKQNWVVIFFIFCLFSFLWIPVESLLHPSIITALGVHGLFLCECKQSNPFLIALFASAYEEWVLGLHFGLELSHIQGDIRQDLSTGSFDRLEDWDICVGWKGIYVLTCFILSSSYLRNNGWWEMVYSSVNKASREGVVSVWFGIDYRVYQACRNHYNKIREQWSWFLDYYSLLNDLVRMKVTKVFEDHIWSYYFLDYDEFEVKWLKIIALVLMLVWSGWLSRSLRLVCLFLYEKGWINQCWAWSPLWAKIWLEIKKQMRDYGAHIFEAFKDDFMDCIWAKNWAGFPVKEVHIGVPWHSCATSLGRAYNAAPGVDEALKSALILKMAIIVCSNLG